MSNTIKFFIGRVPYEYSVKDLLSYVNAQEIVIECDKSGRSLGRGWAIAASPEQAASIESMNGKIVTLKNGKTSAIKVQRWIDNTMKTKQRIPHDYWVHLKDGGLLLCHKEGDTYSTRTMVDDQLVVNVIDDRLIAYAVKKNKEKEVC